MLSGTVDLKFPVYVVSEPYLSFNIDSSSLFQDATGGRLNFSDPGLTYLGKQFCSASPNGAILRIGGSSADNLVFVPSSDEIGNPKIFNQDIRLDFDYWDSILAYADATGCKLIWDLCALSLRNIRDNSWDSSNAELLFAHMKLHNQSIYGWQLGNEPGHWKTRHRADGPDGKQVAQDLKTLHRLLAKVFHGEDAPRIFGPDTCGPATMTEDSPCSDLSFFSTILDNASGVLSGVTVHHYGLTSAHKVPNNCQVDDFLNPALIFKHEEKYGVWRDSKNAIVGTKAESGVAMILGETASAGSGGCENLSNSFAAGFWWLHTLGEVAALQYDQIYRQNFVGWSGLGDASHYALAGDPGWSGSYVRTAVGEVAPAALKANPDFYVSLLWRRLMSATVLGVALEFGAAVHGVSVHAHCTTVGAAPSGAITISYANTKNISVVLSLTVADHGGGGIAESVKLAPRVEYFLTSGGSPPSLSSRSVRLNGATQPLSHDVSLGALRGREVAQSLAHDAFVTLPPESFGFVVLPHCHAQACMSSAT